MRIQNNEKKLLGNLERGSNLIEYRTKYIYTKSKRKKYQRVDALKYKNIYILKTLKVNNLGAMPPAP